MQGHWEGNTLVVVTDHMNDQTRIEANVPRGPRLKVTERWTKAKNTLGTTDLAVTVTAEDPDFLARPWTRRLYFAYRSDVERDIPSAPIGPPDEGDINPLPRSLASAQ